MSIYGSALRFNRAASGGALMVRAGEVRLGARTIFESNIASAGQGNSIELAEGGALSYALPAPSGRWVLVPSGNVSSVGSGAIDADYPYACAAGVVGGSAPNEQSGPQCRGPCPAGAIPATGVAPPLAWRFLQLHVERLQRPAPTKLSVRERL